MWLISRLSLIGLIVLFCLWQLLLAPPHPANPWVILGVQALPLLIFVPGVLKKSIYVTQLACFAMLFYFMYAVNTAVTQPELRTLGLIAVVLSVSFFISSLCWIHAAKKPSE